MKKTLVSAGLALLACGAQAQMLKATQVPAVVKATFKAQYLTVKPTPRKKSTATTKPALP